jgi:hypothetical protein
MRLPTFLLIVLAAPVAAQDADYRRFEEWIYGVRVDALTDEVIGVAVTVAAERNNQTLTLQCHRGQAAMLIYHPGRALRGDSSNQVAVRFRVDSEPALGPVKWWLAGGAVTPGEAEDRLSKLTVDVVRVATRFIVEAVDVDGAAQRSTFNTTGLNDVLEMVGCAP